MNIHYKRTPNVSHMIVECNASLPGYANRMIRENEIPHLLSFSETGDEEGISYWFDITAKKSLKGFFSQEGITKDSIFLFLKGLSDAIGSMEKYLLDPNLLLIGPDTVFMKNDGFGWQAYFACVPQGTKSFDDGVSAVMDHLIQYVDHSHSETVKICYELYEIAAKKDISISECFEVLRRSEEGLEENVNFIEKCNRERSYTEPDNDEVQQDTEEREADLYENIWDDPEYENRKESVFDGLISGLKSLTQKRSPRFPGKERKKKKDSYTDNSNLEDFILDPVSLSEEVYDVTTVLQADKISSRRLCYLGRGPHKDVVIDANPFRIGSRDSGNECVISESVVSRCHATITCEEGEYYLEDLESKNGTFLNGKILDFKSRVKLSPGDRISFANIGYRFE